VLAVVVIALGAFGAGFLLSRHSTSIPKATATSSSQAATSTTQRETTIPATSTTGATQASTAPSGDIITYGSPTGPVAWKTGDPVDDSTPGGEAYYCCHPPSPDGVNRSSSAGCSGSQGQGGYYLNGKLC